MKHLKKYESWGWDDLDDNIESDDRTELINKAKEKLNSSTEDWFDRKDLDSEFYGFAGQGEFAESDEAYLQLFPQDILDAIEESMVNVSADYARIEAANILKGLKESGYKIIKK